VRESEREREKRDWEEGKMTEALRKNTKPEIEGERLKVPSERERESILQERQTDRLRKAGSTHHKKERKGDT
jgi:hypothetical protein